MKSQKFNIEGMTCSSCSSHVERVVSKLNGVQSVNVNLLSNNMIVKYDEKVIDNNKIITSVIDAGYKATIDKENEDKKKIEKVKDNKEDNMKIKLIISVCFWIPLMYISMYHMIYDFLKIPIPDIINKLFHGSENSIIFAFTQFLLLLPILYVNRNYFIIGIKRLIKKSPNMDTLIAIGSASALVYGIFAIYMIGYGMGHNNLNLVEKYLADIYFESAGTILTLITLGKYLESRSKKKTSEAISKLISLAPKTAIIVKDEKEIEVQIDQISIGDILLIKPGSTIGVDGIVIEGSSYVDQSSITGESIPIEKIEGNGVISGTINKDGFLKIKATKVGNDTTLSQIISLVEEASNSKAPISKLADKVSGIFVPTVLVIAMLATILWLINGQSFEFALSIGIAVLVISCPCALGLATPVAIMVGTGKGAQNGIIIKSAESLEKLHNVDTIVLDKTGTITQGKLKVSDIITNFEEEELLKIAGSLEKKSEHLIAQAILEKVHDCNIDIIEVSDFKAVMGKGVKGKIQNQSYYGGNLKYMQENNIDIKEFEKQSNELTNQGKTVLYFANETKIIGIIGIFDTIKDTSFQAIKMLKNKNIDIVMLTGDNKIVAKTIAQKLEINNVIAKVLPQDKEKEILKLQEQGKNVAFVGDGINDSPALVRSDVGFAIGSGTDIAIESADIVLIKNSLLDVVTAISLSKSVIKNIKINLFWAFFYNVIGIPIACGVFYTSFGLKLNPMIGALAMSLSSVCVVLNALRLNAFKVKY